MNIIVRKARIHTPSIWRSFGQRLAIVFGLLVSTTMGQAQGTLYTDRSIFNAALQSSTTVDFENLPPYDGFGTGESPITVSLQPIPFIPILTVTNFEHRLFVAGSGTLNPTPGTGQYIWNFDSSYPMGIFFPGGRNAFAADFSGGLQGNPYNATVTFNLVGGASQAFNFTGQDGVWTFMGAVFPQAISSVIFDDGGPFLPGAHEEMIDNVTYGIAVPEPQLVSICAAAAFCWYVARKRRTGY